MLTELCMEMFWSLHTIIRWIYLFIGVGGNSFTLKSAETVWKEDPFFFAPLWFLSATERET